MRTPIILHFEDKHIDINGTRFVSRPTIAKLIEVLGSGYQIRPNCFRPDEVDWYVWNESVVAWVDKPRNYVSRITAYLMNEIDPKTGKPDPCVNFTEFVGELWVTGFRCRSNMQRAEVVTQKRGLPIISWRGSILLSSGDKVPDTNEIELWGDDSVLNAVAYKFRREEPQAMPAPSAKDTTVSTRRRPEPSDDSAVDRDSPGHRGTSYGPVGWGFGTEIGKMLAKAFVGVLPFLLLGVIIVIVWIYISRSH